jgi:hypothetical protein
MPATTEQQLEKLARAQTALLTAFTKMDDAALRLLVMRAHRDIGEVAYDLMVEQTEGR